MLLPIVKAEARPGCKLWVRFEDGLEGEVDLSSLVGKGVFAVWNDPEMFNQVGIDPESRTVVWPGNIDLAPDGLYEDILALKQKAA